MSTAQGARLTTFWETLPSSSPANWPRPRRPSTIMSIERPCCDFDQRLGDIAPACLDLDIRDPYPPRAGLGGVQYLSCHRLEQIAHASFGARKLLRFFP